MPKMNDLELAVRAIEDILPEVSDDKLEKWHAIFSTAIIKIEHEMRQIREHICSVCLFKEWGHRDTMPIGWRERGDLKICFYHEDKEVADMLQKGLEAEAPEPVNTDAAFDELMAEL